MRLLNVLPPESSLPLYRTTEAEVRMGDGVYPEEHDGQGSFWWLQPAASLHFDPAPADRWLEFRVLSEFRDLSQHLSIACGDELMADALPLVHGWSPLSVRVPAGAPMATLRVDRIFPREYYPDDHRTLAVRLRDIRLHADPERHTSIRRQYDNACLNQQEVTEGRVSLASTPPHLGIDLHGACNVKPPCVYCEWDMVKEMEGENVDAPFTRETLQDWGPFFDNSMELINCSIGEPFMMRNLNELLDIFGRTGKVLEMTTNGQILTEHNVRRLLGLGIDLYVSLDAATPETYAKLRNGMFDRILLNLRRLVEAKGGRGRPPYLNLVFMPMRVNVHELEAFVELSADLGVDRLILRPLNYSDASTLDWERGGYHFDYRRELLPFPELVRASGRARRLCEAMGITLSDQMNFGGDMGAQFTAEFERGIREADVWLAARRAAGAHTPAEPPAGPVPAPADAGPPAGTTVEAPVPAARPDQPRVTGRVPAAPALPSLGADAPTPCLEPWKSFYILRRGVMPCCYGFSAIAPMDDHVAAWNSPIMQEIRGELLAGRFHKYCLASSACPIVRKSEHAHTLGMRDALRLRLRHVYVRFNRWTGGRLIDWAIIPTRWTLIRLGRLLTDPGYVPRNVRRLAAYLRARS